MPVSITAKWISCSLPPKSLPETRILTSPELVNFTALPNMLTSIWRSLVGSLTMVFGMLSSISYPKVRPFSWATGAIRSTASSMLFLTSKGWTSSSILPLSIFEKSRISLMIAKSASPLLLMISIWSRCSLFRSVPRRIPVRPMTAFRGVLISWLILAKNSDFALVAASAASLDLLRSSSIFFRSKISSSSFRFAAFSIAVLSITLLSRCWLSLRTSSSALLDVWNNLSFSFRATIWRMTIRPIIPPTE